MLGDSRYAETTQFDMVRAFVFLAGLPALPFRPNDRIDIVNVDFVADAIATLHQKENPQHDTYHLSSGIASQTFRELDHSAGGGAAISAGLFLCRCWSVHFPRPVNFLANRKGAMGKGASLMKVFMPYLVWNTVFDNTRVTAELGRKPVPFSQYSYPLLKFSRENDFAYPYQDWPAEVRRATPHDGLHSGSLGERLDRSAQARLDAGRRASRWQPGEKLKLLFAGYNGTRNMGSDVRVEEMLRQIRHILGAERVDFSMMTPELRFLARIFRGHDAGASAGYFPSVSLQRSAASITAWWLAKARCSRASSPTRSPL